MNRHTFLHVKKPNNNYTENSSRHRTKFSRPDNPVIEKCAPLLLLLWKYKLTKNFLLKLKCTTNVRIQFSAKTSHSTVVRPTNLRRHIDIKCSNLAVWPTKFILNDNFFYGGRAPSGPGPHYRAFTITDTPYSVRCLRMSVQPDADTATWQHTTLTRDTSSPRPNSNPQSQQASGRRPTP